MDPILFFLLSFACLGLLSYGLTLMPLNEQPRQLCQLGLIVLFVAYLTRHYHLL